MQKILILIFCCFLSLTAKAQLNGQACPVKPGVIGRADWTRQDFTMYLALKQAVEPNGSLIRSPFYARETMYGNQNVNILDLPNTTWRDCLPEDGWVLVQKDFGAPGKFINHPYLILYNRFSGLLRIFLLVGQEDASLFSRATITLTHGQGRFRTATLDLYSGKNYRNPLNEIPFLNSRIEQLLL